MNKQQSEMKKQELAMKQHMKMQRQQMQDFYDSVSKELGVITNLVELSSKVVDVSVQDMLDKMVQKRVEIIEMTLNPEGYAKKAEAEVVANSEEPVAV